MAAPTITNGEEHFFPIIYSGNGQGQRVGKFVPFTDNGTIAKSCMFNDGDSPYLTRTQDSGTGDQKRKATFSWWFKRGSSFGTEMIHVAAAPSSRLLARFDTSNRLVFRLTNGTTEYQKVTNMTFEDSSKWYHCHWQIDASQSTATDRSKVWIDGDQITSWSSDSNPGQNTDVVGLSDGTTQRVSGTSHSTGQYFDGYLAEFNYCDGVITTVDNFGITDTATGRWIPKELSGITYGSNGFRLQFGTDSALGDDTSGNTNDFSSSGLTTSDQRTDTPTNNLPIMRPYNPSYSQTLSEGNLQTATTAINRGYPMCSTLRPKGSGKYYAEVRFSSTGGGNTVNFGCYAQEDLHNYSSGNAYTGGSNLGSGYWYVHGGHSSQGFYHNGTKTSSDSSSFSSGDVLGLALDLDNGTLSFYNDDGNLFGSTTFDSSKSACFAAMTNASGINFIWNFGDNGTFNGNETAGGNADEDGIGNFFHSVPTGFKALTKESMPETDKGVTALTWVKNRDTTNNNMMVDSSRGQSKHLYVDRNDAEQDYDKRGMSKFLKGGYSCGEYNFINAVGNRIVSWNWVANGGTTASNEDGSITSTVQANTTAGFSIVLYNGNSGSAGTIGHGLSAKPEWILVKDRDAGSYEWMVQHKSLGATHYGELSTDNPFYDNDTIWNDTEPTSSVFSIGTNAGVNSGSNKYVAYCWHGVDGFSKFGSYEGNNDADGPFIYTGFKPATVIFKCNASSKNWVMVDNARDKFNPISKWLLPNSNGAEYDASSFPIDFLSNGFKILNNGGGTNGSNTFLYSAWAEHPFVGDGTSPVTAR
jgi:hypothetical protein|tara:strand:- start:27 stop:2456 length:2430 start_codon:yes stop_codon:yes gene_type:complete